MMTQQLTALTLDALAAIAIQGSQHTSLTDPEMRVRLFR